MPNLILRWVPTCIEISRYLYGGYLFHFDPRSAAFYAGNRHYL